MFRQRVWTYICMMKNDSENPLKQSIPGRLDEHPTILKIYLVDKVLCIGEYIVKQWLWASMTIILTFHSFHTEQSSGRFYPTVLYTRFELWMWIPKCSWKGKQNLSLHWCLTWWATHTSGFIIFIYVAIGKNAHSSFTSSCKFQSKEKSSVGMENKL